MSNWKSVLKADPTDWLLEEDNPSVRYFTITDILDRPRNSNKAKSAKSAIMKTGTVPKILAKQHESGFWEAPMRFYTAKYKGTVWQLMILAELGANPADKRIKKACRFILDNSWDRTSGGFSMMTSASGAGGLKSRVIPCLTGNMVWSLIRLGGFDDPRVRRGIEWITTYQRFDDGVNVPPKGWPYEISDACWGRHTCHMGAIKALKALVEIPSNRRSKEVKNTIKEGVEYFLAHHVHKRSHDLSQVSKPKWRRFGFPLLYQTDALEILDILTKLGYRDDRMQEAIDLVISKQDDGGKWILESTFNGRFQVNIERKGKPSKWITLNALKVLKRFYN